MINQHILIDLVKKYYPEGSDNQILTLGEELSRELEIMIHAKIRENVNFERIKKMAR